MNYQASNKTSKNVATIKIQDNLNLTVNYQLLHDLSFQHLQVWVISFQCLPTVHFLNQCLIKC